MIEIFLLKKKSFFKKEHLITNYDFFIEVFLKNKQNTKIVKENKSK